MKESELTDQARHKLYEFETIADIQTSSDWNNSLMNRLHSVKPNSGSGFVSIKLTFVVMFLVLINMGFILNSIIKNTSQSQVRDIELNVVVNELLINPVSINN
jgi:hypothetical protein